MELLAPEKRRAVRMIREELCCKLCGRVFEDPHCLDCKHNFCRECIFLHIRKTDSSCPKCKLPTRPSEITKNQFLQSILSAWKAVEVTLAPLEDPNSAAALDQHELEEEEEKGRRVDEMPSRRAPVGSNTQKWNINTVELKQQAEAAERRANAIEMFGGSLVERAALKSAALDASNASAAAAAAKTPVKRTGFGAAHFNKANITNGATATKNGRTSLQHEDTSQTQMTGVESQLMSPPVHAVRRRSPFSRAEAASPHGSSSLSSLSSPFSAAMGTQDVQGYMQKIQAQNHFLDEWAKKTQKNSPTTGFRAPTPGKRLSNATTPASRSVPTVSAIQHVQELVACTAATTRSPGKRKRQIFQLTLDSSDEDNGLSQTQTQMPGTMADSPDLLGFGGVAPPVAAPSAAGRRSLTPSGRLRVEDENEDDLVADENGHSDEDEDTTWVNKRSGSRTAATNLKRRSVKSEPLTPTRLSKKRAVFQSSQAAPEVVDMTQGDDGDDDDDEVEDSQMHRTLPVTPAVKKRVSNDFKEAIKAFQEHKSIPSSTRLHRLSGRNDSVFDSPPGSRGVDGESATKKGTAAKATLPTGRTDAASTDSSTLVVANRPPLATSSVAKAQRSGRTTSSSATFAFVGTDLTKEESKSVLTACHRLGARFGREFDMKRDTRGGITTSVTHLITKSVPVTHCAQDLGLRCKRTAKYMRALAEGTYVVDYSWVESSLAHGQWLPEHKYEMSGDIYSDAVGKPRESRLFRLRSGHRNEIFSAFQFALLCPESDFDFMVDSLRSIVINFGAKVELAHSNNRVNALPEAPRGKTNLGIVSKVMEPLDARRLYDIYQIPIVRVTWIFDSISHLEVLPFDDYYPY